MCTGIGNMAGTAELERYHRLVLVELIHRARERPELDRLPLDLQEIFHINFDRILKKIESGRVKDGYYLYSEDKFNKDLSICRLKMIPLGAQKVYAGRMSRSFLFRGGPGQFFKGLKMILFDTCGFTPVYRMHTDSRDRDLMKEFNPDGWLRFFQRTAALLKVNPHVKGLCGSSWFFDPALKDISPEITYIRDLALQCGARIYNQGTNEGAVKDATFMNRNRMELYKEGKYLPKNFLMVLPRNILINWAESREGAY